MTNIIWNFVSLVLGTGLGAFLVFQFERRQRRREEWDRHYLAAKYAHFVLLQQYSLLRNLTAQHLAALADNENRWWMLHPILSPPQSFSLDFDSLAFVLRSSDPDLLNRLAVTQERISTLMRLLEQRSNLHAQFQERTGILQKEGAFPEGMFSLADLTPDKIGGPLLAQLRGATDYLFEGVPEAQEYITARLKEIENFMRHEFPKGRPPSYQELPLGQGQEASQGAAQDG
jgi:hypothetical protein